MAESVRGGLVEDEGDRDDNDAEDNLQPRKPATRPAARTMVLAGFDTIWVPW